MTKPRLGGPTYRGTVASADDGLRVIHDALEMIVRHPEMSRVLRAELVGRAAIGLSQSKTALRALATYGETGNTEIRRLEREIARLRQAK